MEKFGIVSRQPLIITSVFKTVLNAPKFSAEGRTFLCVKINF